MLDHASTATARRVRPYNGFLLAVETDVDETTRPTGLIVPFAETNDREWIRAVVTDTAADGEHPTLTVGTVVYFARHQSWRIHDAWLIDPEYVLAVEED